MLIDSSCRWEHTLNLASSPHFVDDLMRPDSVCRHIIIFTTELCLHRLKDTLWLSWDSESVIGNFGFPISPLWTTAWWRTGCTSDCCVVNGIEFYRWQVGLKVVNKRDNFNECNARWCGQTRIRMDHHHWFDQLRSLVDQSPSYRCCQSDSILVLWLNVRSWR